MRFAGAAPRPQAQAAERLLSEAGPARRDRGRRRGALGRAARRPARVRRTGRGGARVRPARRGCRRCCARPSAWAARLVGRAGLGLSWLRLPGALCRRPRQPAPRASPLPLRRARPAALARARRLGAGRPGHAPAHAEGQASASIRPESATRGSVSYERLRRHPGPPAGADRRLRALRLLPAHLSHVRAVGRGDGLAARAHRPDQAGAGGAVGADRRSPRQLPRLHGLRDRLPVRGALRQAAGGRPSAGGAQRRAPGGRARAPAAHLRAVHAARPAAPGRSRAERRTGPGPRRHRPAPAGAPPGAQAVGSGRVGAADAAARDLGAHAGTGARRAASAGAASPCSRAVSSASSSTT